MSQANITGVSEGLAKSVESSLQRQDARVNPLTIVAVSISEPENAASFGFNEWHLQDTLVEISRYLLVHGCKLLYGGDLRKGGFTEIFLELAQVYTFSHPDVESRAVNYFAWPIHLQLSRADETEFKANGFEIRKLPAPQISGLDERVYLKPDSLENRMVWSKSLSAMRVEMSEAAQAIIIIGGRTSQFIGKMPGVLEEILVNIKNDKPIYIAGAFGGIAKAVAGVLQGDEDTILTEGFQLGNTAYKDFFTHWNTVEVEKINYQAYVEELRALGVKGISERNGLTEDENRRLFQTPHITEVTQLILKGLTAAGLISQKQGKI